MKSRKGWPVGSRSSLDTTAWEDLAATADYIARDSENYAATFVQEVKEDIEEDDGGYDPLYLDSWANGPLSRLAGTGRGRDRQSDRGSGVFVSGYQTRLQANPHQTQHRPGP